MLQSPEPEHRLPTDYRGEAEADDRHAGYGSQGRNRVEQGETEQPERHPQRDEHPGKAEEKASRSGSTDMRSGRRSPTADERGEDGDDREDARREAGDDP